jgi:integral membrane sensor domain MASE1
MFAKIKNGLATTTDILSQLNTTVHGSAEAATASMNTLKAIGAATMASKGVTDCIISYKCNDMICFTVSVVGTVADLSGLIGGNLLPTQTAVPFTRCTTSVSSFAKGFVHYCRTGNITFSCKDKV